LAGFDFKPCLKSFGSDAAASRALSDQEVEFLFARVDLVTSVISEVQEVAV
jgi:hypothetical protein